MATSEVTIILDGVWYTVTVPEVKEKQFKQDVAKAGGFVREPNKKTVFSASIIRKRKAKT